MIIGLDMHRPLPRLPDRRVAGQSSVRERASLLSDHRRLLTLFPTISAFPLHLT